MVESFLFWFRNGLGNWRAAKSDARERRVCDWILFRFIAIGSNDLHVAPNFTRKERWSKAATAPPAE
jgi:hypothetical protein